MIIEIYALNKERKSCEFYIKEEKEYSEDNDLKIPSYKAKINDPLFDYNSNSYSQAFDAGDYLTVRVTTISKANGDKDFFIMEIISD